MGQSASSTEQGHRAHVSNSDPNLHRRTSSVTTNTNYNNSNRQTPSFTPNSNLNSGHQTSSATPNINRQAASATPCSNLNSGRQTPSATPSANLNMNHQAPFLTQNTSSNLSSHASFAIPNANYNSNRQASSVTQSTNQNHQASRIAPHTDHNVTQQRSNTNLDTSDQSLPVRTDIPDINSTSRSVVQKIIAKPPSILKSNGDLSVNWRQWKQNFEIYLGVLEIDINNDERACSLFLHTIGQYGRDIFNTLDIEKPHTLQKLYGKFEKHFNPTIKLFMNRHAFFTTDREATQSYESFLDMLRQMSFTCDFGKLRENLLLVQFISGINNPTVQEHLLEMPDLTLSIVIAECLKLNPILLEPHVENAEDCGTSNSNYRRPPKHNRPGFKRFNHQNGGRKFRPHDRSSFIEHPDTDSTVLKPPTPLLNFEKAANMSTLNNFEPGKNREGEKKMNNLVDMKSLFNFENDEPKKFNLNTLHNNVRDNLTSHNINSEKKLLNDWPYNQNSKSDYEAKYTKKANKEEASDLPSGQRNFLCNMDNESKPLSTDKRQMNDLLNWQTNDNSRQPMGNYSYNDNQTRNNSSIFTRVGRECMLESLENMSLNQPNTEINSSYRMGNKPNFRNRQFASPYTTKQFRNHLYNPSGSVQQSSSNVQPNTYQPRFDIWNCKFCGGSHNKGACPAYRYKCTRCGIVNHFEIVCRNVKY